MSRDFKELFWDADQLSEQERAVLTGLLIEFLEPDPDVEAAWSQENA